MSKYKIVDLFAGVGGLSYGFSKLKDFEIIMANEIEQDIAKDPKWRDYINNNGYKTFKILFDQEFISIVAKRFRANEEFFKALLKDKKLFEDIRDALGSAIYSRVENNVMNYGLPDKMMHGMFDLVQPETTQLVADKNIEK